jgi:hypothetical protein
MLRLACKAALGFALVFTACGDDKKIVSPEPIADVSSSSRFDVLTSSSDHELTSSSSEEKSSSSYDRISSSSYDDEIESSSSSESESERYRRNCMENSPIIIYCNMNRFMDEFPECKAENEGQIDSTFIVTDPPTYYRCEQGSWVERNSSVLCDTVNKTEGDVCIRTKESLPTARYVYAGNGVWYDIDSLANANPECNAENDSLKQKLTFGEDSNTVTIYHRCYDGSWSKITELEYYCPTENMSVRDTCSYEVDDQMHYYLYELDTRKGENVWMESKFDPKLGYCPIDIVLDKYFVESEGEYYTCEYGEWKKITIEKK